MSFSQILALTIFLVMFVLIVMGKIESHRITLAGAALMLILVFGLCLQSPQAIFDTLNLDAVISRDFWYGVSDASAYGISWETILFIAGMAIMVEGMGQAGFFRWLCLKIAKLANYKTIPLLLCFTLMSGALSMFIASITVILFLAAVTIELSRILKFDPIPMIVAEIFCANLGGTATMCGDPPNLIIGTALGYTFFDFISNTGSIVGICFLVLIPYFCLVMGKSLKESEENRPADIDFPNPSDAITNKAAFRVCALVFLLTVVCLIFHAQLNLTVSTIGVASAILTLLGIFATMGFTTFKHIIKNFDYKTILFFVGLFIVVCGLETTGVLTVIADLITHVSGGNAIVVVVIILWLSAIASAFIDNIPFAATMVPVIQSMAVTTGMSLETLAWALSLGTNIGGNATPIGASANVVGVSVAAKEGYPITWGRYCKYNVPATIIVTTVAMVCILVKYF